MKTIKIGTNYQLKAIHELRNNHAQSTLKHACELVTAHEISINDMEAFKSSFTNYVRAYISSHEVLKHLDMSTQLNWNNLYKLEKTYKEYFVPIELIDYDIYATTQPQIDGYKYAKKLKELMNEHPLIREKFNVPLLIKQGHSFEIDPEAILMLK
jgi:hypothetical protein